MLIRSSYSVLTAVFFIAFGLLLKGCGGDQTDQPSPADMEEIPQADEQGEAPQPGQQPDDEPLGEAEDMGDMDLIETMIIENLSAMVSALEGSGMADKLQQEGPYTVFAPSDEAFQQAPEQVQQLLVNPDPEALEELIAGHVVEGEYTTEDLANMDEVETMGGETLSIDGQGDMLEVDGVRVAFNDIEAENGVIHTLQSVLIEPGYAHFE